MSGETPGQEWVTATPLEMTCGTAPDAKYCAMFWDKNAECERLRELLNEARIAEPVAVDTSGEAVPEGRAVIVRTGCDGGVLVLALAPETGHERAVEVAHNLHEASGLKVILIADVAAVKAWHPHDAPAELAAAMAETRQLRELVAEICDTLHAQKYPSAKTAEWRQLAGVREGQ